MFSSIPICLLIFSNFYTSYSENSSSKKIFCMHTRNDRKGLGRFKIDFINEHYCTHMIYPYMGIDDEGKIISLNSNYDFPEDYGKGNIIKFNKKKHHNIKLKTLVAVGGFDYTERSNRYSEIFERGENQQRFVNSTIQFLTKYNFDGLALHWVYPGIRNGNPDNDKYSFISILNKLKREFTKRNFTLMAICHGLTYEMDDSYLVNDIMKYTDYIYLFSYDFYGSWSNHIGIASALYPYKNDKDCSVDTIVNNWIERGAQPEKLIIGIPLFGRTFTLKYNNQTDVGSPFVALGHKTEYVQHAGLMSYLEICRRILEKSWTIKWNDVQKNPYAFHGDQWVGFENRRSLEIKSKYVIDKKLAGVAVAFLDDDDFHGICDDEIFPLLKVLNQYLRVGRESDFQYVLNINLFKKTLDSDYTQCVYHRSHIVDINLKKQLQEIFPDLL